MTESTRGLAKNFDAIIGTAIAFTVAATATTALRVLVKAAMRTALGLEDYAIFLALTLYIITEGLLVKCKTEDRSGETLLCLDVLPFGTIAAQAHHIIGVIVGRHAVNLNDEYDTLYVEYTSIYSECSKADSKLVGHSFYFAIIALCIASTCFMYRRILFITSHIHLITTIILLVDLGWWISSTILEIILPATYPETFPGNPGLKQITSVNYLTWWLCAGIIEQVIITTTSIIPMCALPRLNLTREKKFWLCVPFLMSYLCVSTGIARLALIYHSHASHFDASEGDVWINAHLGLAIMCANLPLCWPVIKQRERLMSSLVTWRRSSPGRAPFSASRSKSMVGFNRCNDTLGRSLNKGLTDASTTKPTGSGTSSKAIGGFTISASVVFEDKSDLEVGSEQLGEVHDLTLDDLREWNTNEERTEELRLVEIRRVPIVHLQK